MLKKRNGRSYFSSFFGEPKMVKKKKIESRFFFLGVIAWFAIALVREGIFLATLPSQG